MNPATRAAVSTFGVVAGLAGVEHGVGEVLQGNVAPDGLIIASWPDSALFRILAGEPAMMFIPNLLVGGILTVLVSLVFLVWSTLFVRRKNSGLVLMLLSVVLFPVGGGFGPPLLGLIVGATATRIHAPLTYWRTRLSSGSRHLLSGSWPWSFAAALAAWATLMPGTLLIDRYVGVSKPELLVPLVALSAFVLLLLTIVAGYARDSGQQADARRTPARSGPDGGAA